MTDDAVVSILIPVYNREKYIREAINSALNQTYEFIEVIVVDNMSQDNTWNIIQEISASDNRVKAFQNKKNIGPVLNWQRCIKEASGKFGKILWSDDLISESFVEKTLPYIQNDKDVGFVYSRTKIGKNFENTYYKLKATGTYPATQYIDGIIYRPEGYPVSPGCALFRLNDLEKNLLVHIPNKVDSDFSMHAIGNDLLLFLQASFTYDKFAYVDEDLSFFRMHDDSITISSNDGKIKLMYQLAKAYFIEEHYLDNTHKIEKLNSIIWLFLKVYKNNKYGFTKIEDFYLRNKNFKISYSFLMKFILLAISRGLMKPLTNRK